VSLPHSSTVASVFLQDEAKARGILEQLSSGGHAWSKFALATLITKEHSRPDGEPSELQRALKVGVRVQ
jgi:hypothetical protein